MMQLNNKTAIYFEKLGSDTEPLLIHNQDEIFHPASLLKLFTAVLAKEKLNGVDNKEIWQAIEKSLTISDNDALSYLVDFISETSSGTELNDSDFKDFKAKRDAITQYFKDKGCSADLYVSGKCFSFDAYGRDQQLVDVQKNQITLMDIVTLMKEIYESHKDILKFLKRDLSAAAESRVFNDGAHNVQEEDYQIKFIAAGIKASRWANEPNQTFYSKAGWNSLVRHDAAIFDYEGANYLMVILTKGLSDQESLIPKLSQQLIEEKLLLANSSGLK